MAGANAVEIELKSGRIDSHIYLYQQKKLENLDMVLTANKIKSKVLLLSLPCINTNDEPIFPLGIGYLLASLRQDRPVQALHYQRTSHAQSQLPEVIQSYAPNIVGLTCTTFNRGMVKNTCQWLRSTFPNINIVLGGVHVSFMYEQALRDYGADYVVIGEGEVTLRELCDALDDKQPLVNIKGIAFLDGDDLIKTAAREPVKNLDDIPMPDFSFAGDLMRKSGMGFVISSRGCPVQCSFCSTSSYWGQKVRTNSPQRVVDEMETLITTYGVNKIFFHDDTFNLGIARVREICSEIMSRGLRVEWGVSCRVNPVSQEMIDMMVTAGCRHICWGIESGSAEMLERIGKKITQEQISIAFDLCNKHLGTISVGAFTMVGNPGENTATIDESIQFINTLKMTDNPSTDILYILPGTKLYEELLVNQPELARYWAESDDVLHFTLENTMEELIGWAKQISQSGTIVPFDRKKHFWNNNRQQLIADPNYTLIHENVNIRNGDSIFRRNDSGITDDAIVEPFLASGCYTASIKNIIWMRTDSIGDNVLAAAMLEHIRKQYPLAVITVVCQQHSAELYETCPYIDGFISFDGPRFLREPFYRGIIFKRMQAVNADLALDSVYSRGPAHSLLLAECGALTKIGIDGDTSNISKDRKKKSDAGYTELVATDDGIVNEMVRHQQFLKGIGISAPNLVPSVWTTPPDAHFAENFFNSHNLEQKTTIALFPGSQCDEKIYRHFGEALAKICRKRGFSVIGLGSTKEKELTQQQLDVLDVPTINLCGKVTLRQAAELLRRCRLAVGADSALAHLACAVGTPNVVALGGFHFGRFLPYSSLTSIVCLPLECYWCNWQCKYDRPFCIQGITPEICSFAINESLECNSENPRVYVQQEVSWDQNSGRPVYKETSLNYIKIPADVYFHKECR